MPAALVYLWQAFQRLSRRRARGGLGPQPIAFLEIDAFCRTAGCPLVPWEVEMIERLDDLWCAEMARRAQPVEGEVR